MPLPSVVFVNEPGNIMTQTQLIVVAVFVVDLGMRLLRSPLYLMRTLDLLGLDLLFFGLVRFETRALLSTGGDSSA